MTSQSSDDTPDIPEQSAPADWDSDIADKPRSKARKVPKKVSRSFLMNSALYYLGRFSASRAGVRTVLMRKVKRSLFTHGGDEDEAVGWVESVLDELQRTGYLNDHAFAESRARSLAARGTARRAIAMKLSAKGVDEEAIRAALERLDLEQGGVSGGDGDRDPDLVAAVAYARRRRLGPWRGDPDVRQACRDKDMGALARRGFSADIAFKILNAESIEEAEALTT